MSPQVGTHKAKQVIRALEKLGFVVIRQKGSHVCFKHLDGRFTLVTIHGGEDIGRGLLRQIFRETNIILEEFSKFL